MCRESSNLAKARKITGTVHEDLHTLLFLCLLALPRLKIVIDANLSYFFMPFT